MYEGVVPEQVITKSVPASSALRWLAAIRKSSDCDDDVHVNVGIIYIAWTIIVEPGLEEIKS